MADLIERLRAKAALTVRPHAPHLAGDVKHYVYDADTREVLTEAAAALEAAHADIDGMRETIMAEHDARIESEAALEAAREDACVALVADIRFACGDNGKRMQPELVEFIRELAQDAERLDWFDANWFSAYRNCGPNGGLTKHCVLVEESKRSRSVADTIRQAIDQARGKGGAE